MLVETQIPGHVLNKTKKARQLFFTVIKCLYANGDFLSSAFRRYKSKLEKVFHIKIPKT